MSGCTGRCNQGRTCTCFKGVSKIAEFNALMLVVGAAVVAVGTVAAAAWMSARQDIAMQCEGQGSFSLFGAVYECSVKARP